MLAKRPDGQWRCARPGCSNLFRPAKHAPKSGRTRRRYCSHVCRNYHHQIKHGTRRVVPFGMCKYGKHERTPENTRILPSGVKRCRDCEREAQRDRRALKGRKTYTERQRAYYQEHREEINAKRKQMRALGLWKDR